MSRELTAIIVFAIIVGFPMTAAVIMALANHQRRMAELLHGKRSAHDLDARDAAIHQELAELKELVHRQTIALDSVIESQKALPRVEERLSQGASK